MCGSADGATFAVPPLLNHCDTGTLRDLEVGEQEYNWKCETVVSTVTCTANRQRNAICGSDDGVSTVVPPLANRCHVGTPSYPNLLSGVYTWTCGGVFGGNSAHCFAEYDGAIEQCDDGGNFNGDGCNDVCQLEYCGDGYLDND